LADACLIIANAIMINVSSFVTPSGDHDAKIIYEVKVNYVRFYR